MATGPAALPRVARGVLGELALGLRRLWLRSAWRALDLDALARSRATPERLAEWMAICLDYRHDLELHGVPERWQHPEHTLATFAGDCEDWALLAREVFRRAGRPAEVFTVFRDKDGHAVCVVEEPHRVATLCNEGLRELSLPELERACRETLARRLADLLYPDGWTECGFVATREVVDDLGVHFVYELARVRPT